MRDPKRFLDGDGTAFERALLGAVAAERPSRDLHRKMRLGIGLVGAGAMAKAASANWHQLALAGAVVVGLVTGGAVVAKHQANEPVTAPAVQNVDAYNLQLWALWRDHSYDDDAGEYDDGQAVFAGALFKF